MSRLDELLAAIGRGRRAELAAAASLLPLHEAAGQQRAREWIAHEGRDAGLVLLDQSRVRASEGQNHAYILVGLELFLELFAEMPDTTRCCLDVIAAVPHGGHVLARALLEAMSRSPAMFTASRELLATRTIPHRRLLAQHLHDAGEIDPELAITWFADPSLRPLAAGYFATDLVMHAPRLRAQLEIAKQGEREAIVRLLRRIDSKLTLSGTHDTSTDGELQAQLRASPLDEETAQVWADLMIDRQDPRGELVALELAIRHAEPETALELSRAQAVLAADRKPLWNKPGGFPFREKYRGRSAIIYGSDRVQQMARAGSCEALVDRLQSFIETFTSVRAPRYVYFGRRYDPIAQTAPFDEPSQLSLDLCTALGADALGMADKHGGFVRRERVEAPMADPAMFRAVCAQEPMLTLEYELQLTWPKTRVLLPHQEGEHYAGGQPLAGALRIFLSDRSMHLRLAFPFEDPTDRRFIEIRDAIRDTLGNVFSKTRWSLAEPSADGKKLVAKRLRG